MWDDDDDDQLQKRARVASTRIDTLCGNDGQERIFVDEVHLVDGGLLVDGVVLDNAEAVDPEIALANVHDETHCVRTAGCPAA
jgi:hypothetical protein